MEIEVKLDCGSCLVRPMPSSEFRELALMSEWAGEPFDEKLKFVRSARERRALLKEKARAMMKEYAEGIAEIIVKNNFQLKEGQSLTDFLRNLPEREMQKIEDAAQIQNTVTSEEKRDLSQPSKTPTTK